MTLPDRARALVDRIDENSKRPLHVRAFAAEAIAREAAGLVVELSVRSEQHDATLEALSKQIAALTGERTEEL